VTGRLLVLSLAPSLDRYAWLPAMRLGAINRPREVLVRAGGKGLNAARAAHGLGLPVRALSLAGGETGRTLRALAPPLDVRFVDSSAETRQCLCLLDDDGVLTEVYEPVRPVPPEVWPAVLAAAAEEIPGSELVALCGRVPAGLPVDALAQIVDLAVAHGVPVIVDSDGPALAAAVLHGPSLVKVNEAEAAAIVPGGDPAGLRRLGAKAVVVTTGATGAHYLGPDGTRLTVEHDPIPDAVPVGSGDAFLAGFAAAWLRDPGRPAAALRIAAAAGRANARHLPAGDLTWAAVETELPGVRIVAGS
jgi:1-phosphofructokinase family hexose kinase